MCNQREAAGPRPGDAPAARKPYRKPRVERIPLRPEEAVLGNCKIAGSSGPAASSCSSFVCSSLGS